MPRGSASSLESLDVVPFVGEAEPTVAWVWCVPLRCTPAAERRLLDLLEFDEAERAARFATREQRRRHVVSHGVLRLILSAFNGQDPHAIRIATELRGKPFVAGVGPHFSLSHSADVALIAITVSGPVGVDVERIRTDIGIDTFARGLLAVPDVARIDALPPESRTRAWFQAWTRLEAAAKASGKGLLEYAPAGSCGTPPSRTFNLDVDLAHVGAIAAPPSVAHVVCESLPNVGSALSRFGSL